MLIQHFFSFTTKQLMGLRLEQNPNVAITRLDYRKLPPNKVEIIDINENLGGGGGVIKGS